MDNKKETWSDLLVITAAVAFFVVGVTLQIAVIKLVGGFLHAKEAHDLSEKYQEIRAAGTFYWIATPGLSGFYGGGHFIKVLALCFGTTLYLSFICLFYLLLGQGLTSYGFYKSDCIRIRPPTV